MNKQLLVPDFIKVKGNSP